jgi:hypothetical protein
MNSSRRPVALTSLLLLLVYAQEISLLQFCVNLSWPWDVRDFAPGGMVWVGALTHS